LRREAASSGCEAGAVSKKQGLRGASGQSEETGYEALAIVSRAAGVVEKHNRRRESAESGMESIRTLRWTKATTASAS
jgi:hypothetical protein